MINKCSFIYDPIIANFLIEYRGNFLEQMSKIDYACGTIINEVIGIISVSYDNLNRLRKEVSSIIYVDIRSAYVLQDLSPSYADNINNIKLNPYLDLTGRNVVVGIIDTGINYLNEEFINEDGTSRIISIWDQSIPYTPREKAVVPDKPMAPITSTENKTTESTTSSGAIIPLELTEKIIPKTIFDNSNLSISQAPAAPNLSEIYSEDLSNIKDLREFYKNLYLGTVYSRENINEAIKAFQNNQDPYTIVPSRDTIGHGTKVAGIIGARGKNNDIQGVAHGCDLVIVKLIESTNYKRVASLNNIVAPPMYNSSELISALEFLKSEFLRLNKPMVIYLGIGSTYGSHDSLNLTSRYITDLGNTKGLCIVSGVGNEGNAQGHVSGIIRNVGDVSVQELRVPKELKIFSFSIWLQKPNIASLRIISPSGESTETIEAKLNKIETHSFVFTNTRVTTQYFSPEHFTGHQMINVSFYDIKPGIWRFELIGDYIVEGRYDIWLPPYTTLPEGLVFLNPDPYNTLVVPSTAINVITVAYLGSNNSIQASSGKGFNVNNLINPDIATIGTNILTTYENNQVTTLSGASASSAIVAGACALLLEWGIIKGNDISMYTPTVRSYLIYGATRNFIYTFPNRDIGYGEFNLLGVFNIFAGILPANRMLSNSSKTNILLESKYREYTVKNLFVRIPKKMEDLNE